MLSLMPEFVIAALGKCRQGYSWALLTISNLVQLGAAGQWEILSHIKWAEFLRVPPEVALVFLGILTHTHVHPFPHRI